MPLTDAKIRSTRPGEKPIKLTDGGGLYLEVRPTGAKLWRYRYRIGGKENVLAVGAYFNDKRGGHVSLDDARTERDKARALVKQGIHPAHNRQSARLATHADNANTFEAVAREWIAKKNPGWTAYYLRQVERFLAAEVGVGVAPFRRTGNGLNLKPGFVSLLA